MSLTQGYYGIYNNVKFTNLQADPTKNYEIIFNMLGEENNNQLNANIGLRSILINTDYNIEEPIHYLVNIKFSVSLDSNKYNLINELTKTLTIKKGIKLTGKYILEEFYKNVILYSTSMNTLVYNNDVKDIEPYTKVCTKFRDNSFIIYIFPIKDNS